MIVYNAGIEFCDNEVHKFREKEFNKLIQSLLPKTEWDIEFDEQSKIKLI